MIVLSLLIMSLNHSKQIYFLEHQDLCMAERIKWLNRSLIYCPLGPHTLMPLYLKHLKLKLELVLTLSKTAPAFCRRCSPRPPPPTWRWTWRRPAGRPPPPSSWTASGRWGAPAAAPQVDFVLALPTKKGMVNAAAEDSDGQSDNVHKTIWKYSPRS